MPYIKKSQYEAKKLRKLKYFFKSKIEPANLTQKWYYSIGKVYQLDPLFVSSLLSGNSKNEPEIQ